MVDNGGPAFPVAPEVDRNGDYTSGVSGMTLRDYFAAKAMNGMLSADITTHQDGVDKIVDDPSELARMSYRIADAMIAERNK
jgi:hypothetical protein